MKAHQYCYHITDGITRSALQCGTVTATSMEDAAETAAKRAGLEKTIISDAGDFARVYWTKDGKKRSVYIHHDPSL